MSGQGDGHFYGKYRALVVDNKDPSGRGRIQMNVPAVPGMAKAWAVPCMPYAGKDVGFYAIPPVGTLVWAEFEGGNLNHPIWSGCFWDDDEVPAIVKERNAEDRSQVKVFQTRVFKLWVDDSDKKGEVVFEFKDGSVDEPVTVRFTLSSQSLEVLCKGSKGTSTVLMKPLDIASDSETLHTKTTKDTSIKADGKLEAEAKKDITLKADGKIDGKATGDMSLKGNKVAVEASGGDLSLKAAMNLSAKGSMNANLEGNMTKVSGTATTTIKGALVKIN